MICQMKSNQQLLDNWGGEQFAGSSNRILSVSDSGTNGINRPVENAIPHSHMNIETQLSLKKICWSVTSVGERSLECDDKNSCKLKDLVSADRESAANWDKVFEFMTNIK